MVRNTIPWSLECELEGNADRRLGYEIYTISFDQDKQYIESMSDICLWSYITIGVVCVWVLVGGGVSLLDGGCGSMGWAPVLSCIGLIRPIMIVLASLMIYRMNRIQEVTDSNLDKLSGENTGSKFDCSDEWSKIDLS